eukprot:TRINITY_DN10344_c0_g3_i1.p1 TRINITY_DN10344_c0_g3~~TRINITY_DN10344_c0_g3_i1.p1  ORF type:complete len:310 (+),score=114.35 TRINITY_DN10344_c0_g3_i1:42-932(+)
MAALEIAAVRGDFHAAHDYLTRLRPGRRAWAWRVPQGYSLLISGVLASRLATCREEWRQRRRHFGAHASGIVEALDFEAWRARNQPFAARAELAEEEAGLRLDIRDSQKQEWARISVDQAAPAREAAAAAQHARCVAAQRLVLREETHERMRVEVRWDVEREYVDGLADAGAAQSARISAERRSMEQQEREEREVLGDAWAVTMAARRREEGGERAVLWPLLLQWREECKQAELAAQEAERQRIRRALEESWEKDLLKERAVMGSAETSERWKIDRGAKEQWITLMHLEKLHRPSC